MPRRSCSTGGNIVGGFSLGVVISAVVVLLLIFVFKVFYLECPTATADGFKQKYEHLMPATQKLVEETFDGFYQLYPTKAKTLENIYLRFYKSTLSVYKIVPDATMKLYGMTFEKLKTINCKFTFSYDKKDPNSPSDFSLSIDIPEGQSLGLEQYNYTKKLFLPKTTVVLTPSPRNGTIYAIDQASEVVEELSKNINITTTFFKAFIDDVDKPNIKS